jgi:FG-GAP-like repeat
MPIFNYVGTRCTSTLIWILLVAQSLSGGTNPERHASPATSSPDLFGQLEVGPAGRFRGWRHSQPGTVPRQRYQTHVGLKSGRITSVRRNSSNQTVTSYNGFAFRPDLPAGQLPTAVAAADFNGDGKVDWAISNGQDNTIWLYFGNGDGTSTLPTILPISGLSPTWLIQTDLNGDGKPDLVVAEADTSTVGVFLGNGDGTFQPEVQYSVPATPLFLVADDFTGDGNVDIAVGLIGTTSTGSVAVLPGNGHGHLGAARYTADPNPSTGYWLTAANLRGNGLVDLIVVDPDDFGPHGGAQVYLNNGNGTFTPGQFIRGNEQIPDVLPDLMLSAAVADLNGDGCSDLVLTDTYGLVYVFTGDCDGTFTLPAGAQYALGDIGVTVQLVDVNGDGNPDIVTSGAFFPGSGGPGFGNVAGNNVSILLGDGTGHFGLGRTYRCDLSMYSLAIGDINRDGFPDLIAANEGSNTASVLLNDSKGGFGAPEGEAFGDSFGGLNSPGTPFVFADVDGNGTIDMVLLNNGPYPGNPNQITTFLNDGTGNFSAPVMTPAWPFSTTVLPGSITLADFRNTGHPDLLVVGNQDSSPVIYFAPNIGGGQFGSYTMTTPSGGTGPVAVGDFNGDGKLDFVTASTALTTNDAQELNVFLGNGDGTFQAGQTITFETGNVDATPKLVFTGDFNGDGNLDVLVWDIGLYEFLGNGDGTFQEGIPLFASLGGGLIMADFNHDGFPDIMTGSDQYGFGTEGDLSVFLGQPDGSFKYSATYSCPCFLDGPNIYGLDELLNPFPGILGDFNGDGNIDVALFPYALAPQDVASLQILYGNGDGTFTPAYVSYPLYKPYIPEFAADLNGDGRSDLIELDNFNPSFNVIDATPTGPTLQLSILTTPLAGTTGTGKVILNIPAATATSVSFVASDPSISVPSVTIPAGSASQDFTFSTGSGFNQLKVFSIEAQTGSATAIAYDYFSNPPLPVLEVAPTKLFFDGVVAGGGSATLPLTLKNVGAGTLTFAPILLSTYFTQTDNCGSTLSPGASCTIQVTFAPYAPGDQFWWMILQDTVSGVFISVPIEGVGVSPLQISPSGLGLSAVVGGTSQPQAITLTNIGSSPIQVNSIVSSASEISETNNCTTIPVSGNCEINVTFTPTTEGSVLSTLSLSTNIPNTTATIVPVSGNAGDFALGTTSSQTVNPGQSATYTINATSSGGFSGNVNLSCSGAPSTVSCTVTPAVIQLNANGSTPYSVFVATTPPSSAASFAHTKTDFPMRAGLHLLFGLIAALFAIDARESRSKKAIVLLVVTGLFLLFTSCGGGGGSGNQGGSGTPPGTYSLTITGTADSASRTTNITIVVD